MIIYIGEGLKSRNLCRYGNKYDVGPKYMKMG